jgi:caffeoyl-CoA O-methyltransferase
MSSLPKSISLTPALHEYLVAHSSPTDAVLRDLVEETARLGGISLMQIAPEQGTFMTILTQAIGAKRAIEIGTFTGYSSICVARGLPDDGHLVCCDVSAEWTAIAQRYWERAGLAHKITLHLAPALETLAALPSREPFDLAFIDADKPSYAAYVDALHPRLRSGGLILVDNVLWGGSVVDASRQDDHTRAIRAFNDRFARDPRFDCVMLPISDGLTLLRKR